MPKGTKKSKVKLLNRTKDSKEFSKLFQGAGNSDRNSD